MTMASEREAVRLAAEIRVAWSQVDDPYYNGPWEHLGDAERDVRILVSGIEALAADLAAAQEALETARTGLANVCCSGGVPAYVIRNCESYLRDSALASGTERSDPISVLHGRAAALGESIVGTERSEEAPDDLCDHGCGDDATVQHADGRFLCFPCYRIETGGDNEPPADCPTCAPAREAGEPALPCGHPASSTATADEGTSYCQQCAETK